MVMTVSEIEAKIAADAPPQESAFVMATVGSYDPAKEPGKPWWTGWKSTMSSLIWQFPIDDPDFKIDVPEGLEGYVGQWVCWIENPHRSAVVVVPAMLQAVKPVGSAFDIGTERVTKATPVEELERLIERGYHSLMELVAQEKSKAA